VAHFILCVLGALIVLLLPGFALVRLTVTHEKLSLLSQLTIAPGVTIALTTWLIVWMRVVHLPFGPVSAWLILFLSFLLLFLGKKRKDQVSCDLWPALTLAALLAILLLVRVNATRDFVVAPGVDSAQHTVIVQLLRDHRGLFQSWAPYDTAETFTYHIGFHAVTAFFAWITGLNSADAVFVMARAVGLCAAGSLFALVRLWTKSDWGGVFAVAMWELYTRHLHFFDLPGRWTLLTGLAILPSSLVLFDLFLSERSRERWLVGSLGALTIAGLVLAQYKSALIFVVLAASMIGARCIYTFFSIVDGWRVEISRLILGSASIAICVLVFVSPRLTTVMQARPGQQLKRIVVEGAPMNRAAFGAPQLSAAEIFRTGFNAPQKIFASTLALLAGLVILWRRGQAIWFAVGWVILTLLMNPTLIGIDRLGLIDEIHWKGAVQTAVAALAGLAVGILCEIITDRRVVLWNTGLGLAALALAVFGAVRLPPIPMSSRFVLPDDLRLLAWMKDHIPPNEKIAARSYFDHKDVQGYDAAVWLPYFARHQTNQTSLAADLERARGREKDRQFTRELYQRDMSTPESANWMQEQGFPWFFVGAVQPGIDAGLLAQIVRNPSLELVRKENAALLYRVR
jgi:hypothetical protein